MTGKYSIEYGKKYQIKSYDITLSLDSLRILDNDSKRGHKRNKVLNRYTARPRVTRFFVPEKKT